MRANVVCQRYRFNFMPTFQKVTFTPIIILSYVHTHTGPGWWYRVKTSISHVVHTCVHNYVNNSSILPGIYHVMYIHSLTPTHTNQTTLHWDRGTEQAHRRHSNTHRSHKNHTHTHTGSHSFATDKSQSSDHNLRWPLSLSLGVQLILTR